MNNKVIQLYIHIYLFFHIFSYFPLCAVLSCVWLFVTPWTMANQAPLSMGFSRQEHWSRLPFSILGIFPTQGLNPGLPLIAGRFFTIWATREAHFIHIQQLAPENKPGFLYLCLHCLWSQNGISKHFLWYFKLYWSVLFFVAVVFLIFIQTFPTLVLQIVLVYLVLCCYCLFNIYLDTLGLICTLCT